MPGNEAICSAGQINAVLPQAAAVGAHWLRVGRYTDSSDTQLAAQSANFAIQIGAVSMDFVETTDGASPLLAVQYQDGGFAGAARPVAPGDIVTLHLTGLGPTNPAFPDGAAPGAAAAAIQQPESWWKAPRRRSCTRGVQPQYPGLDQIVFEVPQYALAAGKSTATFAIGAPSVSQTVTYEVPAR
jgi:uncharacterized protein (TIGR03437 family)